MTLHPLLRSKERTVTCRSVKTKSCRLLRREPKRKTIGTRKRERDTIVSSKVTLNPNLNLDSLNCRCTIWALTGRGGFRFQRITAEKKRECHSREGVVESRVEVQQKTIQDRWIWVWPRRQLEYNRFLWFKRFVSLQIIRNVT